MLRAVADEITSVPAEPLLILRHLRLTAGQAARLTQALTAIVDGATDDGPDEPRHGILVGLYRTDP
jgi:hypothetical protein